MIRKFHLAKLAAQGGRAAVEADEGRHGAIPAPLPAELQAISQGRLAPRVTLWGTGIPRREFMYSDDMAEACVFLMNLPVRQVGAVIAVLLWPSLLTYLLWHVAVALLETPLRGRWAWRILNTAQLSRLGWQRIARGKAVRGGDVRRGLAGGAHGPD